MFKDLGEFAGHVDRLLTDDEKVHLGFSNEDTVDAFLTALIQARLELESLKANESLQRLKALGQALAQGSSWDVLLATEWGKDPETGQPCLVKKVVLNTGDLKSLASLDSIPDLAT